MRTALSVLRLLTFAGALWAAAVATVASVPASVEKGDCPDTPRLTITLVMVDEIQVCPPDGYKRYGKGRNHCTVTANQVKVWKRNDNSVEQTVPPCQVSIGRDVQNLLRLMNDADPSSDARKKSIVIMLSWEPSQVGQPVRLMRRQAHDFKRLRNIPDDEDSGIIDGQHWISHARADSFHPDFGVEWTLMVGDLKWVISTRWGPR